MVLTSAEMPKYVAEFIGTYILVLTVGCNILGGVNVWAVTSIASSLMVSIYALGGVSGAHFNPAVTLAIALTNKMPGGWLQAVTYMAVQVVAGVLAGITYLTIFHSSFDLEPGKGHSWVGAGCVEMVYTFMLCFTVLNVACSSASKDNQYYGLAIGYVIVAGGYAVGAVSGGVFNPAVGLGVDLASLHKGFGYSLIYLVFQFAGAGLAALAFRQVRGEDFGGAAKTQTAKLLSEAIGTFLLTATVGFNVLNGTAAGVFSVGACLMCMVYAVGNVSGGHFNPAVTLAVLLSGRGKIEQMEALQYVGVQVVSAVAAALFYVGVMGLSFPLTQGLGWGAAAVFDVIFTFLLCFVVLSVATTQKPVKDMFGLAIGGAIVAGGFAGGAAGVVLNPAVAIGADLGNAVKGGHFGNSLVYTLLEAAGAAGAVGVFKLVRPGEYEGKGANKV